MTVHMIIYLIAVSLHIKKFDSVSKLPIQFIYK